MNVPGLPLLLVTLLVGFAASVVLLVTAGSRNYRVMTLTIKGMAVWCAAYGAILLTTSLTSGDRLLGHGERRAFCGFYLDCHLGATVLHTDRTDRILLPDSLVETDGQFVIVDLRIDNDARGMPLGLRGMRAVAVDASGRRFQRRPDLEFEMNAQMNVRSGPDERIPAEGSIRRLLVFEVPDQTGELRMRLSAGNGVERLLELVLVGDEDSLLHGRVWQRL